MPLRNDSPSLAGHDSNPIFHQVLSSSSIFAGLLMTFTSGIVHPFEMLDLVDRNWNSLQNESKINLASSVVSCSNQCLDELPCQCYSGESYTCRRTYIHAVTVSYPSPIICHVEDAPRESHLSRVKSTESGSGPSSTSCDPNSSSLQNVHISEQLMEEFLELAKDNTGKDLETCGILGAFLDRGIIYVTTLIIPKQECTSNSCQAKNEEEVFAIQHERWIHTHPSQSCFMSSIDLHTQYSYQVMVPEAFAIVMAPTDTSRSYGFFQLTDPGGMDVLRECQEAGFHPHNTPADGIPIYEQCTNVYKNSNLRFEIFDLR